MNFKLLTRTNAIAKRTLRLCASLPLVLVCPPLLTEEKGFFFEIEMYGKTAYVFGSSHASGTLTFPLKPEIESVLNQAPCVAKELPQNTPATVPLLKGAQKEDHKLAKSWLLPAEPVLIRSMSVI